MSEAVYDVAVVGGGLGGLVSSLLLAQRGRRVVLLEKRRYPFHKVCGEYVSNETRPFLAGLGVHPEALGAAEIRHLEVSAPSGRRLEAPLAQGGFGVSRYRLDQYLVDRCRSAGVEVWEGAAVKTIAQQGQAYALETETGALEANLVIGSWGKRSTLDAALGRPFMQRQEPYVGVKYHVRLDFPTDRIALHNFSGGYCGLSAIEDGRYCLCYLAHRAGTRGAGSLEAFERQVVRRNPHLDRVWATAEWLYEAPEVISAFSFAPKATVEAGIWHVGDAAGLITPLCGNGMAMAIHGAKLLFDTVEHAGAFAGGKAPTASERLALEAAYARRWRQLFARRLAAGRWLQRWLFGNTTLSETAVASLRHLPQATQGLVRLTHGRPF
ncbi:MAG: FAD-dependent monooxygenase [Bacteroidia bacterium]|nr:FAD-dependent monooxygenase [Bacteroidia bacterium]